MAIFKSKIWQNIVFWDTLAQDSLGSLSALELFVDICHSTNGVIINSCIN